MKTLDYLSAAYEAYVFTGYCNREQASKLGQRPTSEVALTYLDNRLYLPEAQIIREELTKERDDPYFQKLKLILAKDELETRDLGLVASAIPAYQRLTDGALRGPRSPSTPSFKRHVGLPHWAMIRSLTLISAKPLENKKGKYWLHILEDEEGNRFTCFSGEGSPWWDESENLLTLGRETTVYARVKEHSTYKGIPETRLIGVSSPWGGSGECELYSDAWHDDSPIDWMSDAPSGYAEMRVISLAPGKVVEVLFDRGRGASNYINEEGGIRRIAELLPGRDLYVRGENSYKLHWLDERNYSLVEEPGQVTL